VEGAKHRAPPHTELMGNGLAGVALAPQGPDLLIARHPLGPAPGGFGLHHCGAGWRWNWCDNSPVVWGHRGIAHGLIDDLEGCATSTEHLLKDLREVLEQMKAIGDLSGCRCSLSDPTRIGFRPVAGDHLDPRMRPKPLGQGLRFTIRQQRDGPVALQVNHHRAVGLPFPSRKIVHTEDFRGRKKWERQPADRAQQGMATHGDAEPLAEPPTGRPAQSHADMSEPCGQALRPPCPGGHERCQPLGKDAACAAAIGAEELPHLQVEYDAPRSPGEIRQRADIATVDPPRRKPADGTVDQGLRRGHPQR
jgi:hypothetical protein